MIKKRIIKVANKKFYEKVLFIVWILCLIYFLFDVFYLNNEMAPNTILYGISKILTVFVNAYIMSYIFYAATVIIPYRKKHFQEHKYIQIPLKEIKKELDLIFKKFGCLNWMNLSSDQVKNDIKVCNQGRNILDAQSLSGRSQVGLNLFQPSILEEIWCAIIRMERQIDIIEKFSDGLTSIELIIQAFSMIKNSRVQLCMKEYYELYRGKNSTYDEYAEFINEEFKTIHIQIFYNFDNCESYYNICKNIYELIDNEK